MPGRWVTGGLVSNVWGIDEDPGDEVNLFTFQPFVNYNGCSLFGKRPLCCQPTVFKQLFVLTGAFS
jgi:hypothetical protein